MQKSISRLLFIHTTQNYALNRWFKALVWVPRNNGVLIPFSDNGSNPSATVAACFPVSVYDSRQFLFVTYLSPILCATINDP